MHRLIYSILFFCLPAMVAAQTPALEATVSKTTVNENEVFTYKISSNSDCEITPPDFGDFEVVGGPMSGHSRSVINGVSSQEYSLTYMLRAPTKGSYSIPPATMKCKLKKVNSGQTISIRVVEDNTSRTETEPESTHFLKISASKNVVYVGEPFVISFRFYTQHKPNSIAAIQPGTAGGLWRRDLNPNPVNYMMTQEYIKGKPYYVLEMLREVCIPGRSGKITIEPYYGALIYQADFFSPSRQIDGKSNSLTIDVKALPETLPENFNGLVGRFDLVQQIDKTDVLPGQAIQYSLKISGTGNLNAFDLPRLNLPETFTQSDPEIVDETKVTEDGLSGSLEYKYILTADQPGDYEIQPFSFSYFDLDSKSIRQLSAGQVDIHIEEGDESYYEIEGNEPDIKIRETDIHYIHDAPGTSFRLDGFFFGSNLYFVLLGCPILLVLGAAYVQRIRVSRSAENKAENRQRSARKTALKILDTAGRQLQQGETGEALKGLQQALVTYFMTRLDLSLSGLSQKAITAELENRKVDTSIILDFAHTWKQVELAQYAPVTPQNLHDLINGAKKLINELDEKL